MFESNIIKILDCYAAGLDKKEGDRNIFELDLTLWNLLRTLAKESPDEVTNRFSLSQNVADRLAMALPTQLLRLASGVLLSFKLEADEKLILSELVESYDPLEVINHKINDFAAAYWLLLKRDAAEDLEIAKERFGVSRALAEHVAKATDNQLRYLTTVVPMRFSLRCKSSIIGEILNANFDEITSPLVKKLQQSLQCRRWR